MKRTVKKALKLSLIVFCSAVLLSCSAEAPVRTAKYAVQGLYSAVLSDDGSSALVGSIQHGGSYWVNAVNERRFNWNHAQVNTPRSLVSISTRVANMPLLAALVR